MRLANLCRWLLRTGVALLGKRIDPQQDRWLSGAEGTDQPIGADFFDQLAQANHWQIEEQGSLLADFSQLESQHLHLKNIDPQVQDFYEHTSAYRMTIWFEWNPLVKPFARLFVRSYCRQAQQFNLPLTVQDTCHGVTNRVITLLPPETQSRVYAAWIRCNARTQLPMYVSSFEAISAIPKHPYPHFKVVFPLFQGNAVVFLGTSSRQGTLVLDSQGQRFGDLGLYITQRDRRNRLKALYLQPFQEHLEVFVDAQGQLRGDHHFAISGIPLLRLYYQFDR